MFRLISHFTDSLLDRFPNLVGRSGKMDEPSAPGLMRWFQLADDHGCINPGEGTCARSNTVDQTR